MTTAVLIDGKPDRRAWERRWASVEQAVIFTMTARALRVQGADWTVELGPGSDLTIRLHASARALAADGTALNLEAT